ncbi:MAG: hypothetical protein JJD93_05970 [Ilumatobacteraceae bacterium]|nr:hypothetical protein [Ilumatobacteraceae bacterium]
MRINRWSATALVVLVVGSMTACNPAHVAKQAKNDVDSGNAAACVEERALIEKAVQAYTLLNPDAPVTEAAMVSNGFIHTQSVLMDVGPNGIVVAAPGTVCT